MRRLLAAFLAVEFAVAPLAYAASGEDRAAPQEEASAGKPAQPSATAGPAGPPVSDADALPVSLDRIKQGLAAESTLKVELPIRDDIPRYYVEVNATPDFEVFLEGFDLRFGPVPGAGMTHQEFLQLVTPKDLYSQAGFSALEILTANLGFAAAMYLATKAFNALLQANSERERQEIRRQIQRELAELQTANKKATSGESRSPAPP